MNHWYKTATNMTRHHKPLMLMATLGDRAFFCLHSLLGYVTEHRPTGDLTGLPDAAIEVYAQWNGERGAFVSACVEVGIIDRTDAGMAIHDFADFNAGANHSTVRSEAGKRGGKALWDKVRQAAVDGRGLEPTRLTMANAKANADQNTSFAKADKDLDLERDIDPPSGRSTRERVKTEVVESPPTLPTESPAPKGSKEWQFSEADLEVMKGITFGMIGTAQVPIRLGQLIEKRVQAEENQPGVLPAYYQLPAAKVAAWVRHAVSVAELKAKIRTNDGKLRFAASVIANGLEEGKDLPTPFEATNVVSFQAAAADQARRAVDPRFVGKPWAHLWTRDVVGNSSEGEHLWRLADRAQHFGKTCDRWKAEDIFKAQGVIAAMEYVWSHDPRNPLRGQAAHVTA
jgi:hypothetical protein